MIENPTEEQLKTLTWIIYLIENTENGMKYIGKTYRTFRKRYKAKEWSKYIKNDYLRNSINKYGIQKFKITFLEINIPGFEWLDNLETYYIKHYNTIFPNGFNILEGDTKGNMHQQTKDKLSNIKTKNNNYLLIGPDGKEYRFRSATRFAKEMNLSQSLVSDVLCGNFRECRGFHLPTTDLRLSPYQSEPYKIKDINGNIHNVYNIGDFSKEHNIDGHQLRKLIKGETDGCGIFTRLEVDFNSKGYKMGAGQIHTSGKYEYFIFIKDDKEYKVLSSELNLFCKENRLHKTCVYQMAKSKLKEFNGFKLKNFKLY